MEGSFLEGRCGVYVGVCKMKCSFLEVSECSERSADCFWLNGNSGSSGNCMNLVCILVLLFV